MQNKIFEISFESFGTYLNIKIFDQLPNILYEKIKQEVLDYTNYFDETYSRFKENSLVSTVSKQKGRYSVTEELVELLLVYKIFNEVSGGQVNPFVGNTISDLGYDAKYSLKKKENIRMTPDFEKTLKIINKNEIELLDKVLIDLGAIGKGFWVDKIKKIFEKYHLKKYIIDGSGDIYFCNLVDKEKLNVVLEKDGENIGQVEIYNQAICGSGISKRNWSVNIDDNLHHVIDPKTNEPTVGVESVWVKCENTTYADALATTLFFVTQEKEIEQLKIKLNIDFEYLIVFTNGKKLNTLSS